MSCFYHGGSEQSYNTQARSLHSGRITVIEPVGRNVFANCTKGDCGLRKGPLCPLCNILDVA